MKWILFLVVFVNGEPTTMEMQEFYDHRACTDALIEFAQIVEDNSDSWVKVDGRCLPK